MGAAGGLRPKFIMRWEASSLNSELPDGVLEQKISTGRYRTAAVGSCSGGSEGGFTTYHLAVLLFYRQANKRTRGDVWKQAKDRCSRFGD